MAKLVGYAMMSTNKNSIDNGHLVKAICEFCGKKFSNIEEARKCEIEHFNDAIRKDLNKQIKMSFKENYIMSENCGNCRYCRIDADTNIPYCKKTYTDVNLDSKACDRFEDDNY